MLSRALTFSIIFLTAAVAAGQTIRLESALPPVDNPMKGLVPYAGAAKDYFPCSLEFDYIAYGSIVKGYDEYDWHPLEKLLDDVASRGRQAIFRIFLEYPGKSEIIPEFLIRDGLKIHKYLNTNSQPPKPVETPDYEDPNLRRSLRDFISALGQRYDGDPRIGFITAGLLGTWGEWHTYPRDELFASRAVQEEVLDAYASAFKKTPILLRYPLGEEETNQAANVNRPFGYHDDSFAWATLKTGRKDDFWFFMPALESAGALDKWKRHPIGGEIRPEAWGIVFDEKPRNPKVQNFDQCVAATHVTWLMDSGIFRKGQPETRKKRAAASVQRMGYHFHVPQVTFRQRDNRELDVEIQIENRGVAPFYVDWQPEIGLIDKGRLIHSQPTHGKITGILPDEPPTVWRETIELPIELDNRRQQPYVVAMRVPNPLSNGAPIRFANRTQDEHLDGWLTLGEWQPSKN